MSEILEFIGEAFVFLAKRIGDIFCLAFILATLPCPWRWPYFFSEFKCDVGDGNRWREHAVINFFEMIGDILTIPPLIISLCSWRMIATCTALKNNHRDFYEMGPHAAVWYQFLQFLADIPTFIAFCFCFIPFWRLPKLFTKLYDETPKPLIYCGSEREPRSNHRKIIFKHLTETKMLQSLVQALINFLCGILAIPIILTGLRTTAYIEDCKKEFEKIEADKDQLTSHIGTSYNYTDGDSDIDGIDENTSVEMKKQLRETKIEEEKAQYIYEEKRDGWRVETLKNFLFMLRDILCVPLALLSICSIYRAVTFISALSRAISAWAPYLNPKIKLLDMTFEAPQNDRPKGIVYKLRGTKDANFSLGELIQQKQALNLYVRSEDNFWAEVGRQLGSSAATFGQMLLPIDITEYVDSKRTTCLVGQTDFELVLDFNVKFGIETIKKICAGFHGSDGVAFVQVEIGSSHEETLFYCGITLNDIPKCVEKTISQMNLLDAEFKAIATPERIIGARFADVFWTISLLQFMFLMRDLLTIIGFILLHFSPWRAWKLYNTICQGSSRRAAQQNIDDISDALILVKQFTESVDEYIVSVERFLRLSTEFDNGRNSSSRWYYRPQHEHTATLEELGETEMKFSRAVVAQQKSGGSSSNSNNNNAGNNENANVGSSSQQEQQSSSSSSSSVAATSKALSILRNHASATGEILRRAYHKKHHDNKLIREFWILAEAGDKIFSNDNNNEENENNETNAIEIPVEKVELGSSDNDVDDDDNDDDNAAASSSTSRSRRKNTNIKRNYDPDTQSFFNNATTANTSSAQVEQFLSDEAHKAQKVAEASLEEAIQLAKSEYKSTDCCDSKNEGWDGVVAAVAEQVKEIILDVAAFLALIIVCCSVYRLPWMIKEIFGSYRWRATCINGLREVLLDIMYLLMFVFVVCSVRGTIKVFTDFIAYLPRYPSFIVGRAIISYHFMLAVNAMAFFTGLFFSQTPQVSTTTCTSLSSCQVHTVVRVFAIMTICSAALSFLFVISRIKTRLQLKFCVSCENNEDEEELTEKQIIQRKFSAEIFFGSATSAVFYMTIIASIITSSITVRMWFDDNCLSSW